MVLSNGANIAIVIGVLAFFGSMITMAVIILRRNFLTKTINVGFISDGGHITRNRYKQENIKATLKKGKGRYVYDSKAVVTNWRGKEIYFYVGNVNPIFFNRNKEGINETKTRINPENLKAIIETELIAKLFKKEVLNTENLLILISIVLGVLSVGLLWSLKNGVTIADNPENIALLKKVFVEAVKGV